MPNDDTQRTTDLSDLSRGDSIAIERDDGRTYRGRLGQNPDRGPPTTDEGRSAAWTEKTLLAGVDCLSGSTPIVGFMLSQEHYDDGRNGPVEVVAYIDGLYSGETEEFEAEVRPLPDRDRTDERYTPDEEGGSA
jgi:hypothetical protein